MSEFEAALEHLKSHADARIENGRWVYCWHDGGLRQAWGPDLTCEADVCSTARDGGPCWGFKVTASEEHVVAGVRTYRDYSFQEAVALLGVSAEKFWFPEPAGYVELGFWRSNHVWPAHSDDIDREDSIYLKLTYFECIGSVAPLEARKTPLGARLATLHLHPDQGLRTVPEVRRGMTTGSVDKRYVAARWYLDNLGLKEFLERSTHG